MKNKLLKIGVIIFVAVILLQVISMAAVEKLTLKLSTDKATYKKGETVKVTVSWEEKMEAAGFDLKYDATKLKFKNLMDAKGNTEDLEDFYNSKTSGKLVFNWYAASSSKATDKMIFVFEALDEVGEANLSLEDPRGFGYTGEESVISVKNVDASSVAKVSFEKIGANSSNGDANGTQNGGTQNGGTQNGGAQNGGTQNGGAQNGGSTGNKVDNTIAGGKIPHTGASTTVISIIAFVSIAGFVCYKKYKDLAGI